MHAINATAGGLLLHAGAAALPDGSSVILCGRSGSGKTTLTIRLVESGLSYVTDEVVALHPQTLRITPFRKPAIVKRGAQESLAHLDPQTDEAGATWVIPPSRFETATVTRAPLLPALVVFPTFVPGRMCEVERLQEAEAAYLLGANSSRLKDVRGGALDALGRLARRAPAYRVTHGDSATARDTVAELLAAC